MGIDAVGAQAYVVGMQENAHAKPNPGQAPNANPNNRLRAQIGKVMGQGQGLHVQG